MLARIINVIPDWLLFALVAVLMLLPFAAFDACYAHQIMWACPR